MDAQNLWRVRRGLFILAFLITLVVPSYILIFSNRDYNEYILMFSWGPVYQNGDSISSMSLIEIIYMVLTFIFTAILPSIIFAMGIIGTKLTKQNVKRKENVSRTARVLTQISVTALLFPAVSTGLYSIMQGIIRGLYQLFDVGNYFSIQISIGPLCILPIAIFLAYISYDFPRFHALDFTQESRLSTERAPDELKNPPK